VTNNYVSVGVFPPIEQIEKNKERIFFGKYPAAVSVSVNPTSTDIDTGNREDISNQINDEVKVVSTLSGDKMDLEIDINDVLTNDEIINNIRKSKSFGTKGIKKKNTLGKFICIYVCTHVCIYIYVYML
jgi:membrane-associated protease RseP (regulator of RpoE activity)